MERKSEFPQPHTTISQQNSNLFPAQHLYRDPSSHREGSMHLHYGDLLDGACLVKILAKVRPDEVYNLAAQVGYRCAHPLN